MNNRLRAVVTFLKEPENLITIIGIIVAAILGYSGIKNNDTQQALTAILTVLGALASAQIVANYVTSKNRKAVEGLEGYLRQLNPPNSPPLTKRDDLPKLQDEAGNAKNILIIAWTAYAVLNQTEFFEGRIQKEAIIRLAIVNPDNARLTESIDLVMSTARGSFKRNLEGTIELAQRLACDQFRVKVLDFAPTLDFVMVDGDLPTGHIVVEMLPYQTKDPTLRPHLFITAKDNPTWFKYFHDICEAIWENAHESPRFSKEAQSAPNTPEQPA